MRSSAVVIYLLKGLTCCLICFLLIKVVKSDLFELLYPSCQLKPVLSNRTSQFNKAFSLIEMPLSGCFSFFTSFCVTLETVVCEDPHDLHTHHIHKIPHGKIIQQKFEQLFGSKTRDQSCHVASVTQHSECNRHLQYQAKVNLDPFKHVAFPVGASSQESSQ